jgi:hypothetical protein
MSVALRARTVGSGSLMGASRKRLGEIVEWSACRIVLRREKCRVRRTRVLRDW